MTQRGQFDTHTLQVEQYEAGEGSDDVNPVALITATRKSDGATITVKVYSNGDDGIVLHTNNPADQTITPQED